MTSKNFVIFSINFMFLLLVEAGPVQYYATKYDHLDIERILNNRRMVNYYSQCLLSKGPCPPQGLEFKRILPEALETNCLRCTEKQKAVTYRTIKRLKKEYPKIWVQLQAAWDPNDVYVRKFEETYKNAPLNVQPSATSENEINIDDRFGVISVTKKPNYSTPSTTISTTSGTTSTTSTPTYIPPVSIGTTNNHFNVHSKVENSGDIPKTTPFTVNNENETTISTTGSTTTPFSVNSYATQDTSTAFTIKLEIPVRNSPPSTTTIRTTTRRRRPDDVISVVLSSFLNENRPRITIQSQNNQSFGGGGVPPIFSFGVNTGGNSNEFNPVGNFVRGITSVGGQLLETGSSIADTVLSSVRTLFTPPRFRRVN